jgi:hypothetical protein
MEVRVLSWSRINTKGGKKKESSLSISFSAFCIFSAERCEEGRSQSSRVMKESSLSISFSAFCIFSAERCEEGRSQSSRVMGKELAFNFFFLGLAFPMRSFWWPDVIIVRLKQNITRYCEERQNLFLIYFLAFSALTSPHIRKTKRVILSNCNLG